MPNPHIAVIPAKAGIPLSAISYVAKLDSRFRGNDEVRDGLH